MGGELEAFAVGERVTIGAGAIVWAIQGLYPARGTVTLGRRNPRGWYDNREIVPARLRRVSAAAAELARVSELERVTAERLARG